MQSQFKKKKKSHKISIKIPTPNELLWHVEINPHMNSCQVMKRNQFLKLGENV